MSSVSQKHINDWCIKIIMNEKLGPYETLDFAFRGVKCTIVYLKMTVLFSTYIIYDINY